VLLRNVFLTIIFIAPIWFSSVYAAVYYVAPNGGTGTGTINSPWSFEYANAQLRPGDTAKLLPGIYVDVLIRPAVSGNSESARIVYEANDMNNKPEFRSTRRSAPFLIDLTDLNYVTVDGIRADGLANYRSSTFNGWILFDNSQHCVLKNSVLERSKGYSAISFTNKSKYNKVLDNVISENGTWDKFPWGGVHGDSGAAIWIEPDNNYNLIQGNLFRRSGHDLGIVEGDYNIFRKNIYDNDWGVYTGPAFTWEQGDIQPGDRVGNRTLSVRNGRGNLIEENIFMNTPESVDNPRVAMTNIAGENQIIRKNIFMNGAYEAMGSTVGSGKGSPINIKIYNNTYYSFGGPIWRFQAYNNEEPAPTGNIFKNNIVYKARLAAHNASSDVEFQFFSLDRYYGDQLLNNKITYNCIAKDASASDQKIYAEVTGIKSLNYYENNNPSLINNNTQVRPDFFDEMPVIPEFSELLSLLDTALSIRETVRNALSMKSDSECIDKGGNLTNTTSSGSNTTVITVADAGYFSDGLGLISGDEIRVGLNAPVRITNISTNQITVDKTISWTIGDPVNLIFSGEYPDPGAIEAVIDLVFADSFDDGQNK